MDEDLEGVYDYRDEWFNEPLPEQPKEPKYKLWQIDVPPLPIPRENTSLGNGSTWHIWLLIFAIFFAMMVLMAVTN